MLVCTVCLWTRTSAGLGFSAFNHLLSNVSLWEHPTTLFNGDGTIPGNIATVAAGDFQLPRCCWVRHSDPIGQR